MSSKGHVGLGIDITSDWLASLNNGTLLMLDGFHIYFSTEKKQKPKSHVMQTIQISRGNSAVGVCKYVVSASLFKKSLKCQQFVLTKIRLKYA